MEYITMSKKEYNSISIFEKLKNGEILQKSAAKQLGLTSRQVRNKYKRYISEGPKGLVHLTRGKASKRRLEEDLVNKIVELITSNYSDFGPTFAAEILEKNHGIKANKETLRKIMITGGIWKPKKRKRKQRVRRERRECFGELVQFDGSIHDWLENRGPNCTLLLYIDDATSTILWAKFCSGESTKNVMEVSKEYFERYGRPVSVYTDHGSVYKVNVGNKDGDKLTQFGRALKELDIELIHANSPEAKGRVERCFGTLQDRLIKELRLEGINNIADANRYLQTIFIPKHNKKRSVPPKCKDNLHKDIKGFNLDYSLCIREKRTLANDYTIQYKTRIFQLALQQKAVIRPKEIITVREHLNGQISLWIRGHNLNFYEIEKRVKTIKKAQHKYNKPAKNHPWKRGHKTITPCRVK